MTYIMSDKKSQECVFCQKLAQGPKYDPETYILFRGEHAFVVLNLYPYNNGHLMVLPYDHSASLEDLPLDVQAEMIHLVSHFIRLVRLALAPTGFNVGMNIGKTAGAGIDDHVHIHIVPRWHGDTNFMPIVAETRVIPEWLDETYAKLKTLLQENPPQA